MMEKLNLYSPKRFLLIKKLWQRVSNCLEADVLWEKLCLISLKYDKFLVISLSVCPILPLLH